MYKVIIADDEPMVRIALVGLINWAAIGCVLLYEAVDGNDLIRSIDKYNPDIVISDIKMPGVDGIEIAKYIYDNKLHTKLILLTAYADFSYAKAAIKYDVVEYVTKTGSVEHTVNAINKAKIILQKERFKDNKLSKINFLKSVIDSSIYEENQIILRAKELEINLRRYLVLAVEFSFDDYYNEKNDGDMSQSIYNFFNMAFDGYKHYIINYSKESFVIIIYDLDEDYISRITKMCKDVLGTVTKFMNVRISIGISKCQEGINQLSYTYKQAKEALSHGFLEDSNKMYFFEEETQDNNYVNIKENDKLLDDLSHNISKGNTEKALAILEEVLLLQKEYSFTESQMKSCGFLIQSKCNTYLSDYDTTLQRVTKVTADIYSLIVNSKHFTSYSHIVRMIVKETADYIDKYIKNTNVVILECNRYIEENYSTNITLNMIAQKISINSSYLSRLYKEKTGNTILNTINNFRIEKAKEYLENTDMKIYEIANAIGIEEPTYFSHFFRRYTGCSPKEYKKNKSH